MSEAQTKQAWLQNLIREADSLLDGLRKRQPKKPSTLANIRALEKQRRKLQRELDQHVSG